MSLALGVLVATSSPLVVAFSFYPTELCTFWLFGFNSDLDKCIPSGLGEFKSADGVKSVRSSSWIPLIFVSTSRPSKSVLGSGFRLFSPLVSAPSIVDWSG
jgi:hypothetical protein